MQLGDQINGTKGTKQLNRTIKQTQNIKRLACHNWQTGVDDAAWIEKIYALPTVV